MTDTMVRIDKWLWAARFFKTRSAATDAVHGGKIDVNDESVKPARALKTGDIVRVRIAPYEHVVVVTGTADRRGSAAVAATLYRETPASIAERERQREALRLAPALIFTEGKPSKKDRRALEKVRGKK